MSNEIPPRPIELGASMPNVDAYALGKLAFEVGHMATPEGVGDEIDRGLILVRRLREMGYAVLKLPLGKSDVK